MSKNAKKMSKNVKKCQKRAKKGQKRAKKGKKKSGSSYLGMYKKKKQGKSNSSRWMD
jgi:hypothetical protein